MARAWSFLTLDPADRQFFGNRGYDDALDRYYSFDSTVPNHGRVSVGDMAVLRDGEFVLGHGWIEALDVRESAKERLRCPECGRTGFKRRLTVAPRFRCSGCGGAFDEPKSVVIDVTVYRAVYETTWQALDGPLPVTSLAAAYTSRASQHAIRGLDMESLKPFLKLTPLTSDPSWRVARIPTDIVGGHREARVRRRVGQQHFRLAMLQRFGECCAVTGPAPAAALDAAHLYLFADNPVHDVRGGLLLRRDIHALFDGGWLVIDVDTWTIGIAPQLHVYPALARLHGAPLLTQPELRPDPSYLRVHAERARHLW